MKEIPRHPRLQFSLRGLLLAMVFLGVGLGLFVRWWRTPFAERDYHANGSLAWEEWYQRDWRGNSHDIRTTEHYSNGVKSLEMDSKGNAKFWSPEGTPVTARDWERYRRNDLGNGIIGPLHP